jgi:hypothetical protein
MLVPFDADCYLIIVFECVRNPRTQVFKVSSESRVAYFDGELQAETRKCHSRCPTDLPYSDLHA